MNFLPLHSSSKGNAYLVESLGVAPLMVECGVSIKELRKNTGFSLAGLAGCLASHQHGDHVKGLKDLLKAGVDVWASKAIGDALGVTDHHRFHPVVSGKQFAMGEWRVIPFDLEHDVPCQGFVISAPDGDGLVFITDTCYVKNRFEGFTHLCVECNNVGRILENRIQSGKSIRSLGGRIRRTHMSLERLIEMLKSNDLSRCRQIFLLHLSDSNSDEAEMKRRVQEETGVPVTVTQE